MKSILPRSWFPIVLAAAAWASPFANGGVHHYVFFNRDRERISDAVFLTTQAFEGAQLKYTWREMEPSEGVYDFASIQHDLESLSSHGKKLFIQIQDTSFDTNIVNVPRYIANNPRYHRGADPQYDIPNDDESKAVPQGWVARRWDPAVQERFLQLLSALGKQFDGKIQGINLPETAVDFGESGRLFPKSFEPAAYCNSILTNMAALKQAFPKSIVIQYANFMPGEWLPAADRGYLRSVYRKARDLGVGVGGPDLLPFRPAQMDHSYPLIRECSGTVPTAMAIQWGNYDDQNPKTGKRVTVPELAEFGISYLKADYLFWYIQEPYFSRDVVPFLAK